MSSGRLLVASLLLTLAMVSLGVALRGAAHVVAAADRPRGAVEVPASSYVPFGIALVLLVAGAAAQGAPPRKPQGGWPGPPSPPPPRPPPRPALWRGPEPVGLVPA